ncbi:hypothetical protein SADUNF_Sadunf16G0255000 [Salix dunnii]|uniref:folate gamma-glutamyl hydrolase n=1 Tax=Salix dunnii TaxID=1413687 RepID=A0A835JAF7_9ROSI|nr:hypothetical protein SADUNF_Sadunf16G0255000 [Salix dunnii]
MPPNFLSNSTSTPTTKASDRQNDTSVALPSTSTSSSISSDMLNYLWIPFLISLSKELTLARAAATTTSPSILLPNKLADDSPSAPRCTASDINLNYRPVIGILSHPGDGASGRLNNATSASYIAASYVKFVESAGARVIPLIYNEPREILFEKLNLVNGVLFTGGWAKTGLYFNTAKAIFKEVLARNDAGFHFPVYAICLGFEILTMIISEDNQILETYNATDQASTLQFMENISIEGTVFQRFPPVLLKKLSTDCLVMQNHRYGISPQRFQENELLSCFFEILTNSADEDNQVYVSTVQARNYPVTAFQWHPEKNAFEWGLSMIPHSEDAIQVTQHVANFFVSEARKSLNRPPARKVLDNLIYNYSPTYCGKAGKGYDEVYIFAEPETPNNPSCAVHGKCHGHVKL